MTKKKLKIIIKTELKTLAKEIRLMKSEHKSVSNGYVPGLMGAQWKFRIKHLASCLYRGTPYELIENSHKEGHEEETKCARKQAGKIIEEWLELVDKEEEDVA